MNIAPDRQPSPGPVRRCGRSAEARRDRVVRRDSETGLPLPSLNLRRRLPVVVPQSEPVENEIWRNMRGPHRFVLRMALFLPLSSQSRSFSGRPC